MGQAQTHAPNRFLSMLALLSVIVRPPPAPPPHLPPTRPRCSHSSLGQPWRSRTHWTAPSSALRQFKNQNEVLLIPCLRVRPGKKCPRFVYARGFPWLKKNACRLAPLAEEMNACTSAPLAKEVRYSRKNLLRSLPFSVCGLPTQIHNGCHLWWCRRVVRH